MKDKKDMKLKARKMALSHFREFIKDSMKEDSMPDMEKLMNDRKNKMMKVTVASDSKEGLKKGLSKAEEILKAKMQEYPEDSSSEMPPMEMEDESEEKELKKDCECEDPENCDCDKKSSEEDELESFEE